MDLQSVQKTISQAMYKKVIFASMLIAFVGMQLAASLQCYTCSNPAACIHAKKETCTNATVNGTISELRKYFIKVPTVVSTKTDCLSMKYTNNTDNKTAILVSGCVYSTMNVCNLSLKPAFKSANKPTCNVCNENKCNPAGTFSNSIITVMATIVGLLLAKTFA